MQIRITVGDHQFDAELYPHPVAEDFASMLAAFEAEKTKAGSGKGRQRAPKPGDLVSYRVSERFGDMPFVGTLLAVEADHVLISPNDPSDPDRRMRGTRTSRPEVG